MTSLVMLEFILRVFIPSDLKKEKIKKINNNFFKNSLNELDKNNGIIISPEGLSQLT
jgi:hypothetical protein